MIMPMANNPSYPGYRELVHTNLCNNWLLTMRWVVLLNVILATMGQGSVMLFQGQWRALEEHPSDPAPMMTIVDPPQMANCQASRSLHGSTAPNLIWIWNRYSKLKRRKTSRILVVIINHLGRFHRFSRIKRSGSKTYMKRTSTVSMAYNTPIRLVWQGITFPKQSCKREAHSYR